MGGDRGVGDQRPRCRRPHQQGRLAGQRAGGQREPDVDAGVGDVLVALGELMVGQRGAAAGAVRGDPVVLDQQALGVDLLQRPPDALDEGRVHRPVRLVEVHPVAHPLGELGEGVDVAGDGLAAAGVERLHAVGLDVGLAVEAEFLLDRQFDRQAVAVPAGLAGDVVALHRLEAGEDVLEDPGLDVVGAGHAVGGRRALVEGPRPAAGGLGQGGREGVVGLPERQDLPLHRRQVDAGRHGAVGRLGVGLGGHGHSFVFR